MEAQFPFSYITFRNDENVEHTLSFAELKAQVPNIYENGTALTTYLVKEYVVSSSSLDYCQLTLDDSVEYLSQETVDCLLDTYGWQFVEDYINEVDEASSQDEYHAFLSYKADEGGNGSIDQERLAYYEDLEDFVKGQTESDIPDWFVVNWLETAQNCDSNIKLIIDRNGEVFSSFDDEDLQHFYIVMN